MADANLIFAPPIHDKSFRNEDYMNVKNLANIITVSRIIVSISMVFVIPFSSIFFLLYLYCGISDIIDGYIARKTHTESVRGALLDSIADIVFLAIIAFKLVPLVFKIMPNWSIVVCIIITIVKVMVYLVGYIKFHCFVALHTILNKVMGIVLFLSMYMFMIVEGDIIIVFLCIVGVIAAIEELLCVILLRSYTPDIRTVFELK